MSVRTGRFGRFLGCVNYPACKGILKLDPRKGTVVLPKPPPLPTDLPCPKCQSPLNLRRSKRGPWLSCSKYPKCRGRAAWSAVDPAKQAQLEAALAQHEKDHPVPTVHNAAGQIVAEGYVPQMAAQVPAGADETPAEPADTTAA
jgi:DNA topoisomerase-1